MHFDAMKRRSAQLKFPAKEGVSGMTTIFEEIRAVEREENLEKGRQEMAEAVAEEFGISLEEVYAMYNKRHPAV